MDDLHVDRYRWRGLVGHQGGEPRTIRVVAMPGPSADNRPVVLDAEEQPSAVGEADDGLHETVVIGVTFELDEARLAASQEFVQLSWRLSGSLRTSLRVRREITKSG